MKSDFYSGQWRCSLLLGCTCYTLANGLFHKSDWCYLAASAAVVAVVAAGLRPVLLASFLLACSTSTVAAAAARTHWEHVAAIFSRAAWRRNLRLTVLIAQYAKRIDRIGQWENDEPAGSCVLPDLCAFAFGYLSLKTCPGSRSPSGPV